MCLKVLHLLHLKNSIDRPCQPCYLFAVNWNLELLLSSALLLCCAAVGF